MIQAQQYRPISAGSAPARRRPTDLTPGGPQPFQQTPGMGIPTGAGTGAPPMPPPAPVAAPPTVPPAVPVAGPGPTPVTTPPSALPPGGGAPTLDDTSRLHEDYSPGTDPRLTGLQGQTDTAVGNLTTGPNRTALAQQTLRDFQTQGAIDLANRFRTVGQQAAKFGKIGMGDVNAQLGSIQGDYNRNLLEKQNELAASTAEGDIGDRYRTVGTLSGLQGQAYEQGAGNRGEQRTERQYQQGESQRTIENRLAAERLKMQQAQAQLQGGG